MNRRFGLRLASLLLIASFAGAAPALARYTISCKSPAYRYQYCSASTDGYARLLNQTSNAPCVQGRTWGYDNGGVWVNGGCGGSFEVGSPGTRGDSGAAIAAGVGLAILGAIIANSDDDDDYAPSPYPPGPNVHPRDPSPHAGGGVPAWAIGSFHRTDGNRRSQWLQINPDGAVTFRSAGNRYDRGWFAGDVVDMGSYTMNVRPSRGGVVVDGAPFQRR